MNEEETLRLISDRLGFPGKMISASKSGYIERHPGNLAIFNSNVCTEEGKIWWGDIDVTKSKENLSGLAKEMGKTIYVLFEMDGRFENEEAPKIGRAPVKFLPDGSYILTEGFGHFKI